MSKQDPAACKVTRAEAVALVRLQMRNEADCQKDKGCSHYGLVELRVLLDLIYGLPESDDEKIDRKNASWDAK